MVFDVSEAVSGRSASEKAPYLQPYKRPVYGFGVHIWSNAQRLVKRSLSLQLPVRFVDSIQQIHHDDSNEYNAAISHEAMSSWLRFGFARTYRETVVCGLYPSCNELKGVNTSRTRLEGRVLTDIREKIPSCKREEIIRHAGQTKQCLQTADPAKDSGRERRCRWEKIESVANGSLGDAKQPRHAK